MSTVFNPAHLQDSSACTPILQTILGCLGMYTNRLIFKQPAAAQPSQFKHPFYYIISVEPLTTKLHPNRTNVWPTQTK